MNSTYVIEGKVVLTYVKQNGLLRFFFISSGDFRGRVEIEGLNSPIIEIEEENQ